MQIKRKTKVILWKTVENLGERGKVLNVADGFARNYLFPARLAREATPSNLRFFEKELQHLQKREEKEKSLFTQIAQKWDRRSLIFEVQSNEKGELYGSLSPREIQNKLKEQGEETVQETMISLKHPIKELGVYEIPLNLGYGLHASLWAWVVEKNP